MDPIEPNANLASMRRLLQNDLLAARAKYTRASSKIAEGQKELEEAKAEISELVHLEAYLVRRMGLNQDESPKNSPFSRSTTQHRQRMEEHIFSSSVFRPPHSGQTDSPLPSPKHADVAERILREVGRPMSATEIIEVMEKMGHPLPDDSHIRHSAIYSAMQRRNMVFVRIGRGKWGIVGRDTPEEKTEKSIKGTGPINFFNPPPQPSGLARVDLSSPKPEPSKIEYENLEEPSEDETPATEEAEQPQLTEDGKNVEDEYNDI